MFDSLDTLDKLTLNFSPEGLHFMNVTLGFIMFGIALEIKIDNFRKILLNPKPVIIGFFSQLH